MGCVATVTINGNTVDAREVSITVGGVRVNASAVNYSDGTGVYSRRFRPIKSSRYPGEGNRLARRTQAAKGRAGK